MDAYGYDLFDDEEDAEDWNYDHDQDWDQEQFGNADDTDTTCNSESGVNKQDDSFQKSEDGNANCAQMQLEKLPSQWKIIDEREININWEQQWQKQSQTVIEQQQQVVVTNASSWPSFWELVRISTLKSDEMQKDEAKLLKSQPWYQPHKQQSQNIEDNDISPQSMKIENTYTNIDTPLPNSLKNKSKTVKSQNPNIDSLTTASTSTTEAEAEADQDQFPIWIRSPTTSVVSVSSTKGYTTEPEPESEQDADLNLDLDLDLDLDFESSTWVAQQDEWVWEFWEQEQYNEKTNGNDQPQKQVQKWDETENYFEGVLSELEWDEDKSTSCEKQEQEQDNESEDDENDGIVWDGNQYQESQQGQSQSQNETQSQTQSNSWSKLQQSQYCKNQLQQQEDQELMNNDSTSTQEEDQHQLAKVQQSQNARQSSHSTTDQDFTLQDLFGELSETEDESQQNLSQPYQTQQNYNDADDDLQEEYDVSANIEHDEQQSQDHLQEQQLQQSTQGQQLQQKQLWAKRQLLWSQVEAELTNSEKKSIEWQSRNFGGLWRGLGGVENRMKKFPLQYQKPQKLNQQNQNSTAARTPIYFSKKPDNEKFIVCKSWIDLSWYSSGDKINLTPQETFLEEPDLTHYTLHPNAQQHQQDNQLQTDQKQNETNSNANNNFEYREGTYPKLQGQLKPVDKETLQKMWLLKRFGTGEDGQPNLTLRHRQDTFRMKGKGAKEQLRRGLAAMKFVRSGDLQFGGDKDNSFNFKGGWAVSKGGKKSQGSKGKGKKGKKGGPVVLATVSKDDAFNKGVKKGGGIPNLNKGACASSSKGFGKGKDGLLGTQAENSNSTSSSNRSSLWDLTKFANKQTAPGSKTITRLNYVKKKKQEVEQPPVYWIMRKKTDPNTGQVVSLTLEPAWGSIVFESVGRTEQLVKDEDANSDDNSNGNKRKTRWQKWKNKKKAADKKQISKKEETTYHNYTLEDAEKRMEKRKQLRIKDFKWLERMCDRHNFELNPQTLSTMRRKLATKDNDGGRETGYLSLNSTSGFDMGDEQESPEDDEEVFEAFDDWQVKEEVQLWAFEISKREWAEEWKEQRQEMKQSKMEDEAEGVSSENGNNGGLDGGDDEFSEDNEDEFKGGAFIKSKLDAIEKDSNFEQVESEQQVIEETSKHIKELTSTEQAAKRRRIDNGSISVGGDQLNQNQQILEQNFQNQQHIGEIQTQHNIAQPETDLEKRISDLFALNNNTLSLATIRSSFEISDLSDPLLLDIRELCQKIATYSREKKMFILNES